MRSGAAIGVGILAVGALAGCGASSHKATPTTSSVVTTAPATSSAPEPAIAHRLLTNSELPAGFSAQGDPTVATSVAQWLQGQTPPDGLAAETARLKRSGFVAGASLSLIGSQGGGISVVEQFRSPAGARSELANALASFNPGSGGTVRFSVPGVPHSAGFGGHGADNGVNAAFFAGDYYYLVGEQPNAPANRAAVIASAQKLYQRLHA